MRSGLSLAIIAASAASVAAAGPPQRFRLSRDNARTAATIGDPYWRDAPADAPPIGEHDDGLAILKANAKRARRAAKLKQHWNGD